MGFAQLTTGACRPREKPFGPGFGSHSSVLPSTPRWECARARLLPAGGRCDP